MELIKQQIINNSKMSEKEKEIILKMLNNVMINKDIYELKEIFDKIIDKEC